MMLHWTPAFAVLGFFGALGFLWGLNDEMPRVAAISGVAAVICIFIAVLLGSEFA